MPAAIPIIAGAAATAGAGALGLFGATAAFGAGSLFGTFAGAVIGGVASTLTSFAFSPKKPKAPDLSSQLNAAGAGRTQQVRQPIAPQQVPFGRIKQSGPILFVHSADDDGGRANGYLYLIHGLAGVHIKSIGATYLGEDISTASQFTGYVRVNKHLGATDQAVDADLVSEIPSAWTTDHRLRGIAYIATRLKWNEAAFPGGIPNVATIIDGNDEIYDPR